MLVADASAPSDFELDPATGLPVGRLVTRARALRPGRTTLAGRWVTLQPLDAGAHGRSLYAATAGPNSERLWRYLPYGPYSPDDGWSAFERELAAKAQSEDPLYFAIVDRATSQAVGHASYLRIVPEHACIEVGHILYAPQLQRTAGATEAMYLMAKHVFDDLGYRRYEWKCDALNAPSRRAAPRLGFTFEGVFRQHVIVKGRNRDTAWYAMLDRDWPARRTAFERWLDPSNFDADGQQRRTLAECG
jgi:RimJ/RimL family protein N-acetyltransferase